MNEKIEKVIAKIRHLRELAARAGTQAEAEAAAAMADRILQEYRLSEADLADKEAPKEKVEKSGQNLKEFAGSVNKAHTSLACVLAEHYDCYTYTHYSRNGNYMPIYGRESDIAIVRYMYAWLVIEMERLALKEKGKAGRHAFRLGMVSGIENALRLAKAATIKPEQQSSALVLVSYGEEAERLANQDTKIRSAGKTFIRDADAFDRGRAAAGALNLTGQALTGGHRALPSGS